MSASLTTVSLKITMTTELHSILKRAAELQGCTMSEFVVAAIQDATQRTVVQAETINLSVADQECFARALLSPPPPSAALKRAISRRIKLLRN